MMAGTGIRPADAAFRARLEEVLPDGVLGEYGESYRGEPRGLFHCGEALLVEPSSTREVSIVVRMCNEARVPVVPYGGGTGLVGGQIGHGIPAPVVLSMRRMNRIREWRTEDRAVTVEAGCVLDALQKVAGERDMRFPLLIPASGSCQIGGNLATNAGGSGVLRYGSARDMCLGIEVVLANGEVWSRLDPLHKDNHGYDLRNLLIGSEGTLAVITCATLKLEPVPVVRAAALLDMGELEDAPRLSGLLRSCMGDTISAFELISGTGFRFIRETGMREHLPVGEIADWMVLLACETIHDESLQDRMEDTVMRAQDAGLVTGGIVAMSERQHDELWSLREMIPEANRKVGAISSHDISVPVTGICRFIREAERAVSEITPCRINCFGHFMDGNLHFNVFPARGAAGSVDRDVRRQVEDCVYALVGRHGGSISAEHGTGRLKAKRLRVDGDATYYDAIRSIKKALDPNGVLNPGAIFDLR